MPAKIENCAHLIKRLNLSNKTYFISTNNSWNLIANLTYHQNTFQRKMFVDNAKHNVKHNEQSISHWMLSKLFACIQFTFLSWRRKMNGLTKCIAWEVWGWCEMTYLHFFNIFEILIPYNGRNWLKLKYKCLIFDYKMFSDLTIKVVLTRITHYPNVSLFC